MKRLNVVRRAREEAATRLRLIRRAIHRLRALGYLWQEIPPVLRVAANTMRKWRDNDDAAPAPENMQGVYEGIVKRYTSPGSAYQDATLAEIIAEIKQL